MSTQESVNTDNKPLEITLYVKNMHCASCVEKIEMALRGVTGVCNASVNLASESAWVSYLPRKEAISEMLVAVRREGYTATIAAVEGRGLLVWDWLSWAVLVFCFLLSLPFLGQMVVMVLGFSHLISPSTEMTLATLILLVGGARFYRGACKALLRGRLTMDVLVALGTTVAYGYSATIVLMRLDYPTYFEVSAIITTVILLGNQLERRARSKAGRAIQELLAIRPHWAHVQKGGDWVDISADDVREGDIFIVRAGETFPVDGVIVSGSSYVDESMIWGESIPTLKSAGDKIYAGSINHYGLLEGRASHVGSDTVLAGIVRVVEAAQNSKAPVQRLADKVSAVFIPIVLIVSAATFIAWLSTGYSLEIAILRSIAVLFVACPCALGIATPVVMMVACGRAARAGVFIKNAAAFEMAQKVRYIVFDKTGTLTEGKPNVVGVYPVDGVGEEQLWRAALALEQNTPHPIAQAIAQHAIERGIIAPSASSLQVIPGKGACGVIDDALYIIGSLPYLEDHNIPVITPMADLAATVVGVAREGVFLGTIAVSDPVRPTARLAIAQLALMGISTLMITGDRAATAKAVAMQLGMSEYYAQVLPEEKANHIKRIKSEKQAIVGMVGDGINDAPALAEADLGFAMSTGSDITLLAADIALMHGNLLSTVETIALSRLAFKKIRQNLFFAFGFNALGIPLAALGMLSPLIAGIAMAASSILVVTNALSMPALKDAVSYPDR